MDKKIIADPVSIAAIKYKHSTKRRERNELFMEIHKKYLNKALSVAKKYRLSGADYDNLISIYNDQILYALDKWCGRSSFPTYLHSYLIALGRIYMGEKMHFKREIQCLAGSDAVPDGACLGNLPNNSEAWDNMASVYIMCETESVD